MLQDFNSRCANVLPPINLSYATATVSFLLGLVTILGNLLIILAVLMNPYKRLRTPFNCVVVNLAIADLIVGCVTEPLATYVHVKEAFGAQIRAFEVKTLHLSYFISCMASVLSISLLALERFMAISCSFKYRLYFKVRRFAAVSMVMWMLAISVSMTYFFTDFLFYSFVFINIAVIWILVVTTSCYVKVLRKLKSRFADGGGSRNSSTESIGGGKINSKAYTSSTRYNELVTKTYLIMLLMFLACYTPALLIIYTMNWCSSCSCISIHYMRDIQFYPVAFNSAINPFVYALRFKIFRRSILKVLRVRNL